MVDNPQTKQLFFDSMKGRIDRRQILKRAAALGVAAPAAAALVQMATISQAAAVDEGTLSITYYDWILNLHPSVNTINDDFSATFPLSAEVAPTQGFGIDRFIAEARDGTSTWDAYIGATPFLLPLMLQLGFGLNPLQSGLITFTSTAGAMPPSSRAMMPSTVQPAGVVTMSFRRAGWLPVSRTIREAP